MSQIILFDLDGTLTDSAEGITKCVQYALKHFGIDEPDLEKLKHFVGPPLRGTVYENVSYAGAAGGSRGGSLPGTVCQDRYV